MRLKQLRKTLNKSQEEMAFDLHVEQSTYSRYENGKSQLPLSLIQTIADKYNIDPSEFFNTTNVIVNNDNGSNGNGFVENHYAVPKEVIDKMLSLIEKIAAKSV